MLNPKRHKSIRKLVLPPHAKRKNLLTKSRRGYRIRFVNSKLQANNTPSGVLIVFLHAYSLSAKRLPYENKYKHIKSILKTGVVLR